MLLGQELKFKNKLCNLKLGTFFSALPGQRPGYNGDITKSPCKGKSFKEPGIYKAFALTGRLADCYYTQGDALGGH